MKLSQLSIGEKAVVLSLADLPPISRHKLLDMGLTRGVEVTMIHRAPLGDPLWLGLKGYELSFRQELAEKIVVDRLIPGQPTAQQEQTKGDSTT